MRADTDVFFNVGRRRDDRSGMNALWKVVQPVPVEPLREERVHEVGLAAQHREKGGIAALQRLLPDLWCDDDGCRPRAVQLRLQTGIGKKTDFFRTGSGKRTQAP